MFSEKIKKALFSFISIFVILPFPSFANQYFLNVTPKQINVGDTISIQYIDIGKHGDFEIKILSPTGKSYNLIPHKKSESKYQALFTQTYDKGFLSDNWNQYKVKLYNSKKLCVDSSNF